MSEIVFNMDGKEIKAAEGMTLLEAARAAGISIPTLCWHEKLEPFGACRLCIVEVESRGSTRLVVSCVYPAEKNIIVRTRSEKIDRIRKMILELQMAHAPDAFVFQDLAKEYGELLLGKFVAAQQRFERVH
jgi:NADH dehydrogenase/NADH:ubiquinone oxidoreductase subunit G